MNLMKKIFSVFMALCIFIIPMIMNVSAADKTKKALPLSAGLEALRGQFETDVADECDGYALDYCFYSPAGENDKEKYPVVIYLHGIGHGTYIGSQLDDSTMATWASAELQARWKDTGGAYILLPRCPEDKLQYWNKTFVDPLRTLIDCFIEAHGENVDTTRIFVGGSSAGGEMTWDLAVAYPEYFAGIYPLAATGTRSVSDIEKTKDVSVWLFAGKLDPIVNYATVTLPLWSMICEYNANASNCRLSSFSEVVNPDGSKGDSNHRLFTTLMYDLYMEDGSVYPHVETVNGAGETVKIEGSEGIISWMSKTHSSFNGVSSENDFDINFISLLIVPIRNLVLKIANIIQRILGFV